MRKEKSAGTIVFYKKGKKIYYLLLNYPSKTKNKKNYWDFPKGHIEKKEKEINAAKRELEEETGLKEVEFLKNFKEKIKYFFKSNNEIIFKTVVFYLVRAKSKKVKISFEHLGYKWLPYEEALKIITFKNTKKILEKAHQYLKIKENEKRRNIKKT